MTVTNGTSPREVPGLGTHFGVNLPVGGALAALALFVPIEWPDAAKWAGVALALIWLLMVVLSAPTGDGGSLAERMLAAAPRESRYGLWMRPLLDRVARWLRIEADAPMSWQAVVARTMDWRLLDTAMLVAVVYPLGLLFLHWAWTGDEGRLGSLPVLPTEERDWVRAAAFGGLAMSLYAGVRSRQAIRRGRHRETAGWLAVAVAFAVAVAGWLAVALAVAGAVAVAVAVAGAGAVAVAVAGAGAVAVAGAFAFAFAGAVAGAFAFAGPVAGAFAFAVAVTNAAENGRGRPAYLGLIAALCVVVLGAAALLPDRVDPDDVSLLIFVGLLPLVNALFDFLSLGATLSLMRIGYPGGGWSAAACGALDLALALVLFLLSGCTMIAGVHAMNGLAGQEIVALPALFDAIRAAPGQYWWLFAMLFSTLIPTLLHFAMTLIALATLRPGRLAGPAIWLLARKHEAYGMIGAPLALTALAVLRLAGWGLALALAALGISALGGWVTGWHPDLVEAGREMLYGYLGLFVRFAGAIGAVPAAGV